MKILDEKTTLTISVYYEKDGTVSTSSIPVSNRKLIKAASPILRKIVEEENIINSEGEDAVEFFLDYLETL